MSKYESNITLESASEKLLSVEGEIAVLTHAKPDGDAFGSVVAIVAALQKSGKNAKGYLVPPVPVNFFELKGNDLVSVLKNDDEIRNKDFYVLVDTGAKAQVGFADQVLAANSNRLLIIDHHLSGNISAKYQYIDSDAGAVCEIVWLLVEIILSGNIKQEPLDQVIREAIFVGIVSDTGWFRFSNTRPVTHSLAAKLIEDGVNHSELFQLLEQQERPEKLKLLMRAVGSLELLADQKVAVMTLTLADFKETGAFEEETERLVDIPQKVGSVQLVVLISEKLVVDGDQEKTICRMSFRSKPGKNEVDVAKLASHFGGGGHARAAGAKVTGSVPDVIENVKATLLKAIDA
ncbi:DHH family phosphoesterase [Planctomycetota bacterium]|nr:DHH family phosphoesterase [Planctomycetota bacterium]